MPATHIVLDELAADSEPIMLADDVREALERTGLVSARWAGNSLWKLLPCGKVGAVQVNQLLVEVKPKDKVAIGQLLFLLSYAKDPGFRPANVEAERTSDLWAALGETLARLTERATLQGVMQGYLSRDETLRTVRGRIRISDQATRRPGMIYPVEVAYDEFTVDIAENKILRSAIQRMLSVPRLDVAVRRRLLHLDRKLGDVSTLKRGEPLCVWTPNSLNSAYVPALRIAEIILYNAVAEAAAGKVHVASFVVDMAKVFEDFVTTALTEALRRFPGRTRRQYRAYLDEKRFDIGVNRIKMYVDVVHEVERKPVLIFDAKYKAASPNGQYPNADHYQMLAYATALELRQAWLVYAGSGSMVERDVVNSGIRTAEFPIDLSRSPQEVLERVNAMAKAAWEGGVA